MHVTLIAAALVVTSPAAAQRTGAEVDVTNAVLAGTLAICTAVVGNSFDLNDGAALAQYGFVPASAADEARVRQQNPGAELALATFSEGRVLIAGKPGKVCLVEAQGEHRIATRDELIRQLAETGARNDRHVAANGDDVRVFHFSTHTVEIQTSPSGRINITVKPPGY